LAVGNLAANGISQAEAITLTDILRSNLGLTGLYQVMERSKMSEILREQGFQQSGACDEASCIVEMGQFLGVTLMVVEMSAK
jgi:curli biogenesis system outer membrane secretion channel CsgG